ncbi:MAG: NADPH-dependent glutamate synthase [Planctomycetes bacterium]|nr:NADPH-dependent glutamate synthase [Planctomycetota bacterium]
MTLSPKEKMQIPRQSMPEQDPSVRSHNFSEVPFGYDPETAIKEAQRCLNCKSAPCIKGCPVNIDIPKFVLEIADGKFDDAITTIKKTNLLPAVCGRVCPQESQCEIRCIRGKKGDPVAIGRLERFSADLERNSGKIKPPPCQEPKNKKIAVVGSGPGGLTVAGDLAMKGYSVTIFEALHATGGVLRYGIPEFRLPKEIVDTEVDILRKMGVEIKCDYVIGMVDSIDDLFEQDFDAVYIGVGAGLPWFMNIEGENLNGVYSSNEYLTRSNLLSAYRFPEYDTPIRRGRFVATVGGGNVAMDSCRTAKRLGAEKSYIIYRRSEAEMPARNEEIHHAKQEGIEMLLLNNPLKFIGDDDGTLTGVQCIKMELGEPDASGRRRPVPIEGSEYILEIDTAIISIGNGANPLITTTTPNMETNKWGNILVDEATGKTSMKGVFAGGDITRGGATVILAMGDGRLAANAIDEYLLTGQW